MENILPVERAIRLVGGLSAMARVLDIRNYQVIQQWIKSRVPAERCPDIERATNGAVRCEELRPDVDWAYLRGSEYKAEKVA